MDDDYGDEPLTVAERVIAWAAITMMGVVGVMGMAWLARLALGWIA